MYLLLRLVVAVAVSPVVGQQARLSLGVDDRIGISSPTFLRIACVPEGCGRMSGVFPHSFFRPLDPLHPVNRKSRDSIARFEHDFWRLRNSRGVSHGCTWPARAGSGRIVARSEGIVARSSRIARRSEGIARCSGRIARCSEGITRCCEGIARRSAWSIDERVWSIARSLRSIDRSARFASCSGRSIVRSSRILARSMRSIDESVRIVECSTRSVE